MSTGVVLFVGASHLVIGFVTGKAFGYDRGYSDCWWHERGEEGTRLARRYRGRLPLCHTCGLAIARHPVTVAHSQGNADYHQDCLPEQYRIGGAS